MSNHLIDTPVWLTAEYLEKLLQNHFNDDSLRLDNFSINPGSNVGDNYLGKLIRIQLNFTRKNSKETKSIIMKILPNTELNKEFNKGFDVFKVELTMLSETLPALYEILKEKGETDRFFPYLYKRDAENKTVFMEDLKAEGYVMPDRKISLDLDHMLLLAKALAKLNASSYILFKKDPAHKENYSDRFFKKHKEPDVMEKLSEGSLHQLVKQLDLWPLTEEDKDIYRNLRGKLYETAMKAYERKESGFNCLTHGDCWTNNMMFKYENGKVVSVKLIDFQLSNYNSIGLDLNYSIWSSTQPYVKLEHLEDVFKTYHDTFVSVAGEVEGFTLDTVRNEFINCLPFGFLFAGIFRSGMYAEKTFDLEAYNEGRETEDNVVMFRNEKFIDEAVKVLPYFKKHGVFK